MENIYIKVCKQNLWISRNELVSDTREMYECHFEFDDDWADLNKWVVFKKGNEAYKLPIEDNRCVIPFAPLETDGFMQIGVYGIDGDRRYPTIYSTPIVIKVGCIDGQYPPIPTPSEWEIVIAKLQEIEDDIASIKMNYATKEWIEEKGYVIDDDYVHTDNNFTTQEKTKLDEIGKASDGVLGLIAPSETFGNSVSNSGLLFANIYNYNQYQNKDTHTFVSKGTLENVLNSKGYVVDSNYVHTDNNYSNNDKLKLDDISQATNDKVGLVRPSTDYGFSINSLGKLYGQVVNYSQYKTRDSHYIVSQGTLENVLANISDYLPIYDGSIE